MTQDLIDKVSAQCNEYTVQMDGCGVPADLSAALAADAVNVYEALSSIRFGEVMHDDKTWQGRWGELTLVGVHF